MLIAMLPALVTSAFGGASFFAHRHDGHGVHVHIGASKEAALLLASRHARDHDAGRDGPACPGHVHEGGCEAQEFPVDGVPIEPEEDPEGVLITIPNLEQRSDQKAALAWSTWNPAPEFEFMWPRVFAPTDASAEWRPAPRGRSSSLLAAPATVCERLVRTSCALLI